MKNNILRYVLVLSLVLNFSLLGAAGYSYYQQNRLRPLPFGYGTPGRVPGGYTSIHPYLFEALSLKPEQRRLFEQKAPLFHQALDKKREEVDRLRRSLFELMGADHPDSKAIEATVADINEVQEIMQQMIVAHMLGFKSMLDKDQQKKFFNLIQGAMMRKQKNFECLQDGGMQ
jgi:Spy/CpxP family protein refolding chaperone